MNDNDKALVADTDTVISDVANPPAAPARKPRKTPAQVRREAAAREIEAVSHAPVAMQVAHAPHGSSEDSNSAPLPADYPYKNRIKRADYERQKAELQVELLKV